MTREWQIKIGEGDLAYAGDLGCEGIALDLVSLSTDTATLTFDPAVDDIPYGTLVEVHYAGVRRFLGRCVRSVLAATGTEARRTIRLAGPWEWLERIPYRQAWQIWQDDELGAVMTSRVILNQDATGASVTVAAQIAAIVAYAASAGAPLAFGSATVGVTLPWDEQRDIRCAAAIARLLRFSPDVTSWINYAVDPPAISFGQGAAVTLPAGAESVVTGYRDDLVVPGLQIEIERISSVATDDGNASYRTLEYLQAGDLDAVDALFATLQLAGSDSTRTSLRVDVQTEDIPDPLENAAWWIARHPRLKGIEAADLVFIQTTRHNAKTDIIVPDPEDYPRISLNPMADLTALNVRARVERFKATVDVVKRNDGGEIVDAEHGVELALDVITTNATTREYVIPQSVSSTGAEPAPANLATELLAHFSVRYAEGTASWPARALWAVPGRLLYGTPIQSVRAGSDSKLLDVVFGPPAHLSVSDFAELLQGFRTRRAAVSWEARQSGEPAADSEIAGDVANPARAGGFAPGEKRQMTVRAADGEGGAIEIIPSQLADDETIAVREISWKDSGDVEHRAKILATDDVTQDDTDPPDGPPPPCGHPGNEPGAGGESDAGDDVDHPGDEPGGGSDDGGGSAEHPGDSEGDNGTTPVCGDAL